VAPTGPATLRHGGPHLQSRPAGATGSFGHGNQPKGVRRTPAARCFGRPLRPAKPPECRVPRAACVADFGARPETPSPTGETCVEFWCRLFFNGKSRTRVSAAHSGPTRCGGCLNRLAGNGKFGLVLQEIPASTQAESKSRAPMLPGFLDRRAALANRDIPPHFPTSSPPRNPPLRRWTIDECPPTTTCAGSNGNTSSWIAGSAVSRLASLLAHKNLVSFFFPFLRGVPRLRLMTRRLWFLPP